MLSSGLAIATGATTWWGCSALTWDMQYRHFVSPKAEDVTLGAKPLGEAIHSVDQDTVICLDEFTEQQQKAMVAQLGKKGC